MQTDVNDHSFYSKCWWNWIYILKEEKCLILSNDKVKETELYWNKLLISSGNPASATFSLLVILELFPSVLSCGLCFLN